MSKKLTRERKRALYTEFATIPNAQMHPDEFARRNGITRQQLDKIVADGDAARRRGAKC